MFVGGHTVQIGETFSGFDISISGGHGFWVEYLQSRSPLIMLPATASDVQGALREIQFLEDVVVTQISANPPTYRITPGPQCVLVEIPRVYSYPPGHVTATPLERSPIYFLLEQGPVGLVSYGTFQATPGRSDIGNLPERRLEYKVREWFFAHDLLGGIGTRILRPQNRPTNVCYEGDMLMTHAGYLGMLPKPLEDQIDSQVMAQASSGGYRALTAIRCGMSKGGPVIVAAFDETGDGTESVLVYQFPLDRYRLVPGIGGARCNLGSPPIDVYYRHIYIGWKSAAGNGYYRWSGVPGQDAVFEDLGVTVRAFCVFDFKLYALTEDNRLLFAVAPSIDVQGRDYVTKDDWQTAADYVGPGTPYAMVVFRSATGADALHVVATDGIYQYSPEGRALIRKVDFNTSSGYIGDGIPQPNSVAMFDGELWFTINGNAYSYDGNGVRMRALSKDDGLPEHGLVLRSDIYIRALAPMRYGILACATNRRHVHPPGNYHPSNRLVLSGTQTQYHGRTVMVAGSGYPPAVIELNGSSRLIITASDASSGTLLIWTGQGWCPLVPTTESTSGNGWATCAALHHSHDEAPKIVFAPGRYLRWLDELTSPYRWQDQRWRTRGRIVFPIFYSDLRDLVKTGYSIRIGYEGLEPGDQIRAYWQYGSAPDGITTIGNDPSSSWVPFVREDGSPLVISIDPPHSYPSFGTATGYFTPHRAQLFYEIRILLDVTNGSELRTPLVLFCALLHSVRFRNLWSYTVNLRLEDRGSGGLTAPQQELALRQLIRSAIPHRVELIDGRPFYAVIEAAKVTSVTPGEDPTLESYPRAVVTLSEYVSE